MNLEVMELYKKHGINPLGGCLPMLIQMPIYIALYSMLGNSVELYRSGFVGWIHDLTAPDPFFVLPLLTGVLMFVQQKLSPTPPDPQQKMMMYMMPVMFTAFSIFLPAGLTIYILTNTLLTMRAAVVDESQDDEAGAGRSRRRPEPARAMMEEAANVLRDAARARWALEAEVVRARGRRAHHARGEGAGDRARHRQEGADARRAPVPGQQDRLAEARRRRGWQADQRRRRGLSRAARRVAGRAGAPAGGEGASAPGGRSRPIR